MLSALLLLQESSEKITMQGKNNASDYLSIFSNLDLSPFLSVVPTGQAGPVFSLSPC
jgi:hypothetical protein